MWKISVGCTFFFPKNLHKSSASESFPFILVVIVCSLICFHIFSLYFVDLRWQCSDFNVCLVCHFDSEIMHGTLCCLFIIDICHIFIILAYTVAKRVFKCDRYLIKDFWMTKCFGFNIQFYFDTILGYSFKLNWNHNIL